MASTNFIDKTTVVPTAWLNEVNGTVWTLFGAASTASAGRTALGLGTMATQNDNSVNITGGSISGLSGTFTTTSSSGGDFVVFSNTAAGAEAATRINTTQASSGVALKLSNSSLNVQASVRGRSDGGLSLYSGQGAGTSSTSGVQALDVNPDGDIVVGNSPKINNGRLLTIFNNDTGPIAYSRLQVQSNSGTAFLQVNSIAGGRAVNLYSNTGASLNIFTQDSQALNLGTDNVATRLTISSSGAVNAGVSLSENNTRVFSRNSAFVSPERSVAANTDVQEAHGLAGTPALVRVVLICKTAEYGYVVGEEVEMNFHYVSGGGQVGVSADSTNVYIEVGGNINLLNKLSKPNIATITYANWRWVIRAWY